MSNKRHRTNEDITSLQTGNTGGENMPPSSDNESENETEISTSSLFHLTLDDVILSPFVDLTVAQQERQRSKPFERYGLQWIITLEKEPPSDGDGDGDPKKFNILVVLYCLSVSMNVDYHEQGFPLKGDITVGHQDDGQPVQVFNALKGQVCNVVGKNRPADAVKMNEFNLSLESGTTKGDTTIVMLSYTGDNLGGYYGPSWRGAGGLLLENHSYDSTKDGAAIKVTLQFKEKPRPLCFMDG
mmetsp:Transcript_62122/g.71320  ORF Transcript_62122/g.71320 Transcript_62122/m.71320 type:complete len:242 (-) Transcript_62122:55-780(-)